MAGCLRITDPFLQWAGGTHRDDGALNLDANIHKASRKHAIIKLILFYSVTNDHGYCDGFRYAYSLKTQYICEN